MITGEVLPRPAYVEIGRSGEQVLSCDLVVTNATARSWTLAKVEVSVHDASGAFAWRRFLDGNGVRPGIQTVPQRALPPQAHVMVMNPLPAFPADLELARVRFTLTYEDGAGAPVDLDLVLDVEPVIRVQHARLRLPVVDRVIVWDGHDLGSHHRRWDYLAEPLAELGLRSNPMRYSYDLLVVDAAGRLLDGDPDRNESWFGFGRPLVAPAAGTVVRLVDTAPDDRRMSLDAVRADPLAVYGNVLAIDHGHGEHSLLGHVQQGSARVAEGDRVEAGQEIAATGAAGSSLAPHLHYQLQAGADGHAEGLPSTFHDLALVRGSRRRLVERAAIDSGDVVEPADDRALGW